MLSKNQLKQLKSEFTSMWTAQAGRITGRYGSLNTAHQIYNCQLVRELIAAQTPFYNHAPKAVK